VYLNDTYCQEKYHNDACRKYVCTPLGEDPFDKTDGCKQVYDTVYQLEQTMATDGRSECFKGKCVNGNAVPDDQCKGDNPNCYTYSCDGKNGVYKCQRHDYMNPTTKCKTYACPNNKWELVENKTDDQCETLLKEAGKLGGCDRGKCDDSEGCIAVRISGCNDKCNKSFTETCIQNGLLKSDTEHCYNTVCTIIDDQSVGKTTECQDNKTSDGRSVVNCYEDTALIELLRIENNKPDSEKADPTKCFSISCANDGGESFCAIDKFYKSRPTDIEDTRCMAYKCVESETKPGEWLWKYVATEENKTCVDNACGLQTCDPVKGCIVTKDICVANSTDCIAYTCSTDATTGALVCLNQSLLETTTCTEEVCENGKKVLKDIAKDKCALPDLCHYATCIYYDENKTSKCEIHEPRAPGNDPCIIYECNPSTGVWKHTEKCDDGLFCTNDRCSVKGECRNNPLRCSEEINMTGFPCFEARCKEGENDHKCVRKLIPGAYIDICGNCIKKDVTTVAVSDSSSVSISSESEDELVSCTGAPPRPILTEGLAAAAIALIIIAAVVGGAGITASGVITTKQLIARAKGASNQSAHSNPLFEDNEAEMTNPAFVAVGEGM